jgi:hypothetical protein
MSLGPTVALVAAGLAVAGGASYVSLMHGDGSRAPGTERMVNDPRVGRSIDQLSPYLDATFASLRSTTRAETEVTATASIGPAPTFAERFAGVMSGVVASSAPTRSIAGPKVRAAVAKATPPAPKIRVAALRLDERQTPQPEPKPYQVASYAPTRDDTAVTEPFNFRSDIRVPPLPQAVTSLVPLDSAPFPVRGGSESASAGDSDKRVRIHFRSRISWEHGAYSDPPCRCTSPRASTQQPAVMSCSHTAMARR